MAVNLKEKNAAELLTVDGAQVFIGQAGIKKAARDDLTLIVLNPGNTIGAVFTQNRFCAAPVHIAQEHLSGENGIRALIINTGNATQARASKAVKTPKPSAVPLPNKSAANRSRYCPFPPE